MKRWLAARLAAWLWPYFRTYVQDVIIAHEAATKSAAQDRTVAQAERVAKRYIGK